MDVVATVIEQNQRFLICQRPPDKRHGGLWEFPGGKVEAGETFLEAARRELREELGVFVAAVGPTVLAIHDPGSPFVINFIETIIEGTPRPLEHSALAWVPLDELLTYDLAHSDRHFSTELIKQRGNGT